MIAATLFGVVAALALAHNSGSAPAAAASMKSQAEDAGGRHSHGVGDELARGRSRRAAGGRERFG
jgi:hypothetical protein